MLCAPIRRFDLLLGKVLAVTALAALTGLLNLASMSVTLIQVMHLADPGSTLPVPWTRAAAAAGVVLPSAFLFASLFVAVGAVARGFKEAQHLLTLCTSCLSRPRLREPSASIGWPAWPPSSRA